MSNRNNAKVYYNSACPICNAGIQRFREHSLNQNIDWLDVHSDTKHCAEINTELNTVRKYLHVRDEHGQLRVGINAFIVLLSKSTQLRSLSKLLSLPLVNQLAQASYFIFANGLFYWNRLNRHW